MGMDVPAASQRDASSRLEELKAEKGRLGRDVAEARKAGGDPDALIRELQQVSAALKKLQKELKKQRNNATAETRWTPPTISLPSAIKGDAVSGPVTVRPCSSQTVAQADAYVAAHPGGSIWHRPKVADFVRETYGHRTVYFCAFDVTERVVGVLPVVQLNSRLFGNYLVSVPYFNYGGALADSAEVAEDLVKAASRWQRELMAGHLELRFSRDTGAGRPQRTDKVTFWLPLPDTQETLWQSFQPKLRAQIRRGERELTDFSVGGVELLDEFYRVFSINMRDLGTPVYGKVFFRNLLETLVDQAWLVVARVNGQAVGCAFLTVHCGRMEIPWASTLRSHSHTAVNMAMYWRILRFAIEKGCAVFDFGRCSETAGTYRFKQQWGAQPLRLHWDYVLPEGAELPALNPDNPKFRLLIAVWQRLPVPIANLLGPHIIKVLP